MFQEIVSVCVLLSFENIFIQSQSTLSDILEETITSAESKNKIRPLLDDGVPLKILLNINVNEITSISETEEEYSLIVYIRQTWKDSRLSYTQHNKSIDLNPNQYPRIWTPDLIVKNLKKGFLHQIVVPNRQIRLSPDGTIFYSQRISMTLICRMVLDMFPMDNQTCYIEMESYGYNMEHVILKWDESSKPVELVDKIILQEFEITGITHELCVLQFQQTGNFSCLKASFHFKRRINSYILNTYLPSTLVVVLSWLSFWIDPDIIPARTSLTVVTILTVISQTSSLAKSSGPFTKASDIWMSFCIVFVFSVFIEYSIVNTLSRRMKQNKLRLAKDTESDQGVKEGPLKVARRLFSKEIRAQVKAEYQKNPVMLIDYSSRILFPTSFVFFNIVYWSYYLSRYTYRN